MSIDKEHENFCSITDKNDGMCKCRTEASLGLAQECKGFEWPHVVPLLTLNGSIEGKLCKRLLLIDSGSSMNFVSGDFVKKHCLQVRELKQAFKVRLADGRPLSCVSTIDAALVSLTGDDEYIGSHQLMVLDGLRGHDVVLGRPFLSQAAAVVDHDRDRIEWKPLHGRSRSTERSWRKKQSFEDVMPIMNQSLSNVAASTDERDVDKSMSQPEQQESINPSHEIGSLKQRRALENVIADYKKQLEPLAGQLPPHRGEYDHSIKLRDPLSKPVKLPAIRQRPALARAMKEKLDELLKEGKIQRSKSAYGAPAFMVEQGDKQRMVVNFVKLNEQTEMNATSLPHIDELIARLSKAKVFSKLDLTSGFHQVRMNVNDIEKTGFTTPFGHYEWTVMPFGEKNAPASFVQLLNQHVLADLVHDFIIVFVDDVLIFSENSEQHVEHVRAVLDRLRDHQLFINPSKCTWMVDQVDFLGYRLRAGPDAVELMIQENKVRAVADWPIPTTISQLRSFLGTANFSRPFIKDFSVIAAPLTSATAGKFKSKNARITWGEREQLSFDSLKRALTSAPALAVPDETKPFFLFTDASDFGIGATLCQFNGTRNALQACGYMSSKLSGAELNWTTHEKEMFAVVRALEHWSMHFVQVVHPIKVFTDNIALLYLLKGEQQNLLKGDHGHINGRRARWMNTLMRFKLDPQRIEGSKNVQADALSRRPDLDGGPEEVQAVRRAQADKAIEHLSLGALASSARFEHTTAALATLEVDTESGRDVTAADLIKRIKTGYAKDAQCLKMMKDPARYHVTVEDGIILNESGRIIVPAVPEIRSTILLECHDSLTSGHLGTMKTAMRIRRNFEWHGMVVDAHEYVKSCSECQMNKARNAKEAGLLQPISAPMNKGLVISIDFVGELPRTARGKDFLMVIVDKFSKRAWYEPTKKTITAKQAARVIFEKVVRHQGLPDVIISDRDPRFKARLWKALWRECGTKLAMTVSFRAQANGGTETHNRVVQDMLRAFVNDARADWDLQLPALEIAYNASRNEATGFTPFELDIGMQPRLPIDIASRRDHEAQLPLSEFMSKWEDSWALAHKHIIEAQARMKSSADGNRRDEQYKVGDMAWVRRERGTLHNGVSSTQKLGPRNEGPYKVTELHGDHNVTLKLDDKDRRHPKFHVSQLRPYTARDEERFPTVKEALSTIDDEAEQIDQSADGDSTDEKSTEEPTLPRRNARQRKQVDYGVFIRH